MGDHKASKSLTSRLDCICIFRDTNVFQYINKERNKCSPLAARLTGWTTALAGPSCVSSSRAVTFSSDLDPPAVRSLLFARRHVRFVTTVACYRHNRICYVQFASHTAKDQNETFLNLSLYTTWSHRPRLLIEVSGQLRSLAALPRCPLNKGPGGSQSRSGRFLFLAGFEPQIGQSGARIPVRY